MDLLHTILQGLGLIQSHTVAEGNLLWLNGYHHVPVQGIEPAHIKIVNELSEVVSTNLLE